jgi:hypothetical protein
MRTIGARSSLYFKLMSGIDPNFRLSFGSAIPFEIRFRPKKANNGQTFETPPPFRPI